MLFLRALNQGDI